MKIAIVGTGSIGSTFALHLSRAGHEVTVVARGARLAQSQSDGAIVTASGDRVIPAPMAALEGGPLGVKAAMFWAVTRTPSQLALGALGHGEARTLFDMMTAAAPGRTDDLPAVRP